MQRLSGLDASFLYLETPSQPLHVCGLVAEKHPVVHNLVISNVPGPPMPIYLLGCRVVGMYPLGPVFHGAGLNITVLSNDGRVDIGLIACQRSAPGLWALADAMPAALDELLKQVP